MGSVVVALLAGAGWADTIMEGTFDWRDVDGKDYTTPIRDQGPAGTCWAFAAIGALESKLEITADRPNWDPDLSEQHLVEDPNGGGDIIGGWPVDSLRFIRDTGVVSEAELPYSGEDPSPDWPLTPGWEDRVTRVTSIMESPSNSTQLLKMRLQWYGPMTVCLDMDWDFWVPGEIEPEVPDWGGVVNHAVIVVGFHDDPTLAAGGYWILKNSWGTEWGDNGYGYSLYGFMERHGRFRAIDGDAFPLPEPASMSPLAAGALLVLRRRRAA